MCCNSLQASCRIVKLVLRNNALSALRGIENLKSLEGLDLSYNIISSFTELEILASLSCLLSLWLEGNPICCARWYRAHVFSFFSNPEKASDGFVISILFISLLTGIRALICIVVS